MRREPVDTPGLVADAHRGWPQPRVLLIEDDPADALLVEELVIDGAPGWQLNWVRSLSEADEYLRAGTPNCILLDLHLPDAQGLEALARVRDRTDVAVVVLTGLDEEHTGMAAVAAGAQDYLIKGRVEPELFGRAVRYAIQRKQAEQTSAALQASQMRAQENARLERGLLPTPLLPADTAVAAVPRYRPGRAHALLGGDFYDVVQDGDAIVHVVIGDVSGHGPDAAAAGVALRLAWRTLILSGVRGARLLRLLEQVLLAERADGQTFATATCLELHPDDRSVRVLRAGHPGMLMRCDGEVSWLEVPGGPALGFLPGRADWPIHHFPLAVDCGVMLMTDGLFEGCVGDGPERLGEDGLLRLARAVRADSPDVFLDTLIAEVEALAAPSGGLDDDVALLYLHWTDSREARG